MAQERSTTPEKQLLDLIEDPRGQDVVQKKIKRRSFNLFSLSALRGRISFLVEAAQSGALFKKTLPDIKGLNKALKICVILLAIYLAGNFIMSLSRIKQIPAFGDQGARAAREIPLVGVSGKKISYYLEGPRSRDIFKFGDFGVPQENAEAKTDEVAAPAAETALSQAELLAQQLGLVGIGWSDDPDVMVENVESKKIYFLKRGQKIDGLIKVEAIFEDKVILTYDNGKEMELR
jgi:hypothetical protein